MKLDNERKKLVTEENLSAVSRDTAPKTKADFDYFVTQLITAGRIALSEGVKFYYRNS